MIHKLKEYIECSAKKSVTKANNGKKHLEEN
jgi:hypothetical protein